MGGGGRYHCISVHFLARAHAKLPLQIIASPSANMISGSPVCSSCRHMYETEAIIRLIYNRLQIF